MRPIVSNRRDNGPTAAFRRGTLAACAAVCVLAAGLAACRTTERAARVVLRTTPQGRRVLSEFDRYARIAHLLRKYHDSGILDERDVLDVLRKVGVLPRPRPKGAPPPPPPAPFPVPEYRGQYRWPLEAGVVSSEYGRRWGRRHHGIDIAADQGVPVVASADGEVVYAGDRLQGYGNAVIVRHDQKTTTLYAHNSSLKVGAGEKVRSGQVVALLGSTGRSTGPHVHFELRVGGRSVDPRAKLPKSRF